MSSVKRVIARRRLEIGTGTEIKTFTVEIGMPRCNRPFDWTCPFWISGFGARRKYEAKGVDSVQARVLALEGARVAVKALDGPVSFPGEDPVQAGELPRYVPNLPDPKAMNRIEQVIDREIQRFYRTEKKAHEQRARKRSPSSRSSPRRTEGT